MAGLVSIVILPQDKKTLISKLPVDSNKIAIENITYLNKKFDEKKTHLLDSLSSSGDSCYISNITFSKGPSVVIPIKKSSDSIVACSNYSTTYSITCTPKKSN